MSDSSTGPVFPPFGPARSRPSAPASAPTPPSPAAPSQAFDAAPTSAPAPAYEPPVFRAPASEPEVDLPFMAPFGGAEARGEESAAPAAAAAGGEEAMPWEMPSVSEQDAAPTAADASGASADGSAGDDEGAGEDLPWLEMPPAASHSAFAAEPSENAAFASDVAVEQGYAQDAGAEPAEASDASASADVGADASAPAGAQDSAGGLPDADWLSWEAPAASAAGEQDEEPEALPVVPPSFLAPAGYGDSDAAPDPGVVPLGDMLSIPESAGGYAEAGDAHADTTAELERGASGGGEYAAVADRLERIARSLRESPAAFLGGGSSDALDLLVTGFVLGYTQRVR